MRQTRTFVMALVAVLLTLTLAGTALAFDATVDVGGEENIYTPETVTIGVGETITWTNVGGYHNVVADDGSFDSGAPSVDDWVYTYTFNIPGTYTYYCTPHQTEGMTGTVIVEEATAVSISDMNAAQGNGLWLWGALLAGLVMVGAIAAVAYRRTAP